VVTAPARRSHGAAMRGGGYAGWWYGPADLLGGVWWAIVVVLLAGGVGGLVVARAQLRAARADRHRLPSRAVGASVAPGPAICPRCRSLDLGFGRTRADARPGLVLWVAALLVTWGAWPLPSASGRGPWGSPSRRRPSWRALR